MVVLSFTSKITTVDTAPVTQEGGDGDGSEAL
jgi:hypothetical protein